MVGGHPAGLAAAERELGLESRTLALRPSPYGYPIDEIVWDDDGRIVGELKRWRLLPRVLRDFDVIHFNFGSTLAPQRLSPDAVGAKPRTAVERAYAAVVEQLDLRILARAGKAIFVTFQGSDARQGEIASRFAVDGAVEAAPEHYSSEWDGLKRRRIGRFDRHADRIYALNPDLLRGLPERTRFVPYAHVDPRTWKPEGAAPAGSGSRPLVVHAPTHRGIKGTPFVLEAVSQLQAEGLDFDFELVEGLTQTDARKLLQRADILVDQLFLGWYGGIAVEAMSLERPTVAYLREADLSVLPSGMRAEIPVISAEPRTIRDVIRDLLTTRRAELDEIGRRGRDYVRKWHDPLRIASELVADYEAALARRQSRTSSSRG
jgi:hypothetical protein